MRSIYCVSTANGHPARDEMLDFVKKTLGISLYSSCREQSTLDRNEAGNISSYKSYVLSNAMAQ